LRKLGRLQFATADLSMGRRSPLLPDVLTVENGQLTPYMRDKYMYPGDFFPTEKEMAAEKWPSSHRDRQGPQEFPFDSNIVEVMREHCTESGCHLRHILQKESDPCEPPTCFNATSGFKFADRMIDDHKWHTQRIKKTHVKVCDPMGCKIVDQSLGVESPLKKQVEWGQVGGQADPFGVTRMLTDDEEDAEKVFHKRRLVDFNRRKYGGEPLSDMFVRGADGWNGVGQGPILGHALEAGEGAKYTDVEAEEHSLEDESSEYGGMEVEEPTGNSTSGNSTSGNSTSTANATNAEDSPNVEYAAVGTPGAAEPGEAPAGAPGAAEEPAGAPEAAEEPAAA